MATPALTRVFTLQVLCSCLFALSFLSDMAAQGWITNGHIIEAPGSSWIAPCKVPVWVCRLKVCPAPASHSNVPSQPLGV